jgi:hypothetical protein
MNRHGGAAQSESAPAVGAARTARTLVLVNGSERGVLGDRSRWILDAAGANARVAYRAGGRARAVRDFVRSVVRERPAIVYLVDTAVATVFAGALARILKPTRVILDTGDATAALVRSAGRGGRAAVMAATFVERLGYALADVIVVRSEGLAAHVRAMCEKRVVVVPDGFDPAHAGIRTGEAYRRQWGFHADDLVVGVVGSAHWNARLRWCYGRDVVEVVAAAKRPHVVGAVLVRGDGLPHLRELSRRLGVSDRIVFASPADGEQVWEQLAGIDIALSTQTNDAVGRARTTGKLVHYMAAGKFILASRVGTAADVLPDEMLVDYNGEWDHLYFTRVAERLRSLPDRAELRRKGERVRQAAAPFAYPILKERLLRHVLKHGSAMGPE